MSVSSTAPEVAWVGLTEDQAKAQGVRGTNGLLVWTGSGRAIANGRDDGSIPLEPINLENAVGSSSEQRKANTGAAFKPIPGAAPQFQTGGLALSGMLNCDNALVNFHTVNCGI